MRVNVSAGRLKTGALFRSILTVVGNLVGNLVGNIGGNTPGTVSGENGVTLILIPFSFHYMVKCRKQANHGGRFGAMTHGWHLDDKRGSTGQ